MSSETTEESTINMENCFKILLATDIHLGYKEKDMIIGNDSFIAFEEILTHAQRQQVDFILLGGDLFHDTNPSKETMQRCLELLRRFTLGDSPICFEILSDHEVNYDDPNMNIAIPVFSIHGNHDDPSGRAGVSSMDVLSTSGLLNYFGRCVNLEEVRVSPILMKKGDTQLALYGLSHIHDNRLARLFRDSKFVMDQPNEQSGDWFNMMVLHQNRVDRGPKNYIPQEILPQFLDFVLWGHEHDCRVWPEPVAGANYYISQPGSSVATSLSEGESIDKHIAVLYVCGNQFKCEEIKLETVRPFVFKSIDLNDYEEELEQCNDDIKSKVKEIVTGIVNSMIDEAKQKHTKSTSQPKKPLIRLRVSYQNEDYAFNEIRFGQQYNDLVANPTEMVKMHHNKKRVKVEKKPIDETALNNAFNQQNEDEDDMRLEDYVERYFKDPENENKLQVMFSTSLSEVCRRLAEQNDDDAATSVIDFSMKKACDFLNEKMPDDFDIDNTLIEFQTTGDQVYGDILKMLSGRKSATNGNASFMLGADDNAAVNQQKSSSNARGSRATKSTAAKATTSKSPANTSKASTSGRGRGGRGTSSSTRSTTQKQQPTIQEALTRKSTRPTKGVVYDIGDSD